MILEFNWFQQQGVLDAINLLYKVVDIIRIIVPIGLIILTSIDITKKVINPEEKDGQKKIMIRAIAALIVFLVPTFIRIGFKFADIDVDNIKIDNKKNTPIPVATSKLTPTPTITPIVNITPTPTISPTSPPTLNSISIINCPQVSTTHKVGSKIKLETNIPSSFNGDISWKVSDTSVATISESSSKKEATVELLTRPATGAVWVTVLAGGKASSCSISISSVDTLEITNCPNNKIYYVGDKITLKSNLPSNYKGNITWGSSTSPNTFKITPSSDQREALIEILEVPKYNYAHIGLGADGKGTSCKITIKEKTTVTPVPEVNSISIVNCPNNQVFKKGDTITFRTNVPSYFNGEVEWGIGYSGQIDVLFETNNEYKIKIGDVTGYQSISVIASLDTGDASDSCKFYVEP